MSSPTDTCKTNHVQLAEWLAELQQYKIASYDMHEPLREMIDNITSIAAETEVRLSRRIAVLERALEDAVNKLDYYTSNSCEFEGAPYTITEFIKQAE